ncbi:hypothetical protein GCM10018954_086730 [Kutzneria kofuensis]
MDPVLRQFRRRAAGRLGFLTIWQFADKGTFPGDQDRFNGAYDRLKALANG